MDCDDSAANIVESQLHGGTACLGLPKKVLHPRSQTARGHMPLPSLRCDSTRAFRQQKQSGVCIYTFLDGYLCVHCWRRTLSFKPDSEVKGAALWFILS